LASSLVVTDDVLGSVMAFSLCLCLLLLDFERCGRIGSLSLESGRARYACTLARYASRSSFAIFAAFCAVASFISMDCSGSKGPRPELVTLSVLRPPRWLTPKFSSELFKCFAHDSLSDLRDSCSFVELPSARGGVGCVLKIMRFRSFGYLIDCFWLVLVML